MLCLLPQSAFADAGDAAFVAAISDARLREEADDPAGAVAALARALALSPDDDALADSLFRQSVIAGDFARASVLAAKLWGKGERRIDVRLVYISGAIRKGDWRAARSAVGDADDKTGDGAGWLAPPVVAWTNLALRYPDAAAALNGKEAIRRRTLHADHHALLLMLAAKDSEAAVLASQSVAVDDMAEQMLAHRIAGGLAAQGKSAATDTLRARIKASGDHVAGTPLFLSRLAAPRNAAQGLALWMGDNATSQGSAGNRDMALLLARNANWLSPDDIALKLTLADALDFAGYTSLALDALGPDARDDEIVAMRRAELLGKLEIAAGARQAAARATADPAAPEFLLLRQATLLRQLEERDGETAVLLRLLDNIQAGKGNPGLRVPIMLSLADNRIAAGDWPGGRALLERALAIDPDNATLLNFAGYSALERRENVKLARAQIAAAWQQAPENPAYTDSLGWAHFVGGDYGKAVDLLTKAARGDADNPVIHEHLGDALWQAGRRFEARYSWQAAQQLGDADMTERLGAKLASGLTAETTAP